MKLAHTTATELVTLGDAADDPRLDTLSQMIVLADDGKPPTEFCMLAAGETRTTKGSILCDDAHAALCLSVDTMPADGQLPIDYDHGMVSVLGGEKRAAGWFKLSNRNGALWATDVKFTPAAARALADREYRYFSPALYRDEDGYVTRIVNCALTCLPATLKQKPLVTSETPASPEGSKDMTLEQLCAAFGVANATQLATLFSQLRSTGEQVKTENATLVAAGQALSVELAAFKAADAARAAETAKAEKSALIVSLSAEGKLAPAMHGWAQTQTVDQLKAYGACAPVVGAVAGKVEPAVTDPTAAALTLSAEEAAVCVQLGVSPKDFVAQRAVLAAQQSPFAPVSMTGVQKAGAK
jgi:phage I-like protein